MDNVVRVIYEKGKNQLGRIGTSTLESWTRRGGCSRFEDEVEILRRFLISVDSGSYGGVVLKFCYTNLNNYYARSYGCNMMVYPIEGEVVYRFNENEEVFLNSDICDPRILVPNGYNLRVGSAVVFLKQNPFNDGNYSWLLQSSRDLDSVHSRSRYDLIRQIWRMGLGSMDSFSDD